MTKSSTSLASLVALVVSAAFSLVCYSMQVTTLQYTADDEYHYVNVGWPLPFAEVQSVNRRDNDVWRGGMRQKVCHVHPAHASGGRLRNHHRFRATRLLARRRPGQPTHFILQPRPMPSDCSRPTGTPRGTVSGAPTSCQETACGSWVMDAASSLRTVGRPDRATQPLWVVIPFGNPVCP